MLMSCPYHAFSVLQKRDHNVLYKYIGEIPIAESFLPRWWIWFQNYKQWQHKCQTLIYAQIFRDLLMFARISWCTWTHVSLGVHIIMRAINIQWKCSRKCINCLSHGLFCNKINRGCWKQYTTDALLIIFMIILDEITKFCQRNQFRKFFFSEQSTRDTKYLCNVHVEGRWIMLNQLLDKISYNYLF